MTNRPVDFDEFSKNYDDLLRQATGFFVSDESYFASYKVSIVRRELSDDPENLLEFGCGIGRNIPFLAHAFPSSRLVGTDISRGSLDVAQKINPGVEFHLEPHSVNNNDLFDVIFIAGVFHPIPVDQRREVLATLRQRLRPDGSVFIFEHNPFNPVTRRIVSNCRYDEDAVLLSPRNLRLLLGDAGFRVLKHRYCLFFPPRFRAFTRFESQLGWVPLGGQYWVKAARS